MCVLLLTEGLLQLLFLNTYQIIHLLYGCFNMIDFLPHSDSDLPNTLCKFFIETRCYAIRLYLIYILYVSQLSIILLQCLLELPSFIMSSLDFPLNLHDYSWVGKRIQTSHQAFPDAPWLGGKKPTVLFPTWSPLTS